MNDLFREQMLKAGLVTKKQAKAVAHEENVTRRKRRKKKSGEGEVPEIEESVSAALEAKRIRDKELNLQREAERAARAVEAEVSDLIRPNILRDVKGDLGYKYTDASTIKTLYVSKEIQLDLASGAIGIVRGPDGVVLVPRETALRVEERAANRLLLLNDADESSDEDDPYAAYKVPDDLMW
tara:strand:- start:1373 stop:1918 length:546 start_codon:yes stop_codon:yes gene_type:complete